MSVFEQQFIALEFDRLSFKEVVEKYNTVLKFLFEDNIYNYGRYLVADCFARYIAKRLGSDLLLSALRRKLVEKWRCQNV
jgi:hypothetical protein